jgi:transcriptional regulator with XRE-family HTH domain
MTAIGSWTGREARALRQALRLSVRGFAEHLDVAPRTVSKWEKLGEATRPYPDQQALLDTALDRAGTAAQERFILLLNGNAASAVRSPAVPASWDYESWTDDLDRAIIALSHQDFAATARLLEHWLSRFPAGGLLDDRGLYLHARSLVLLGDSRRDQGQLRGPRSAAGAYRAALAMFTELDIPRRVAQVELSLTVVAEMTGQLGPAARGYARLAEDERLSARDRARARLWIGTALSKDGQHGHAARVITAAARELEELGEAEDWSVAHQKLALAYRGTGDLSRAQRLIAVARDSGTDDTPLQKVRLSTAQAHILLTDPATRAEGLTLLDGTAGLAAASGLSHQLTTIESIRKLAS